MKSMKKILIILGLISFTCASYGQLNTSSAYRFEVWQRPHVGAQASLWSSNDVTILESRNNIRFAFTANASSSGNQFLFRPDMSFSITSRLASSLIGTFFIRPGETDDRFWLGTSTGHTVTIGAGSRGVVDFLPDRCTIFYKQGNDGAPINISVANRNRYAIFVEGGILSEDYALGPRSTWADFVFDKEYQLMPLSQIEEFIAENNRLPDIPSELEVQQEGYSLHDMNVKLLQKIEELTLYSIQQNKEIESLKQELNSYQSILKKVEELESKLNP